MTKALNEVHGRIQMRQRNHARPGRHFMEQARKGAGESLIRREDVGEFMLRYSSDRLVKIFTSEDGGKWWRQLGAGLTTFSDAHTYTLSEAFDITTACTEEKIAFRFVDGQETVHQHEVLTANHPPEYLFKLFAACESRGISAEHTRRCGKDGSNGRFFAVCSDEDWNAIQEEAK